MLIDVDRVYRLIPGMCRRRVQQNRPNLDELDVEERNEYRKFHGDARKGFEFLKENCRSDRSC
jgi:hypothetical protein